MGVKSIKVPQPEFSNWVIQRRQELGLSPAGLSEKLNGALSERTLKYLEDGKKESFSEYTLTILPGARSGARLCRFVAPERGVAIQRQQAQPFAQKSPTEKDGLAAIDRSCRCNSNHRSRQRTRYKQNQ